MQLVFQDGPSAPAASPNILPRSSSLLGPFKGNLCLEDHDFFNLYVFCFCFLPPRSGWDLRPRSHGGGERGRLRLVPGLGGNMQGSRHEALGSAGTPASSQERSLPPPHPSVCSALRREQCRVLSAALAASPEGTMWIFPPVLLMWPVTHQSSD